MTSTDTQPVPYQTIDVPEAGPDDQHYFSVTTILKALSSPALEYWSQKRVAQDAIDRQATWNAMLTEEGRVETVKWLCKARYRSPKLELASEKLGTVVHRVCEEYALSGQKPSREWVADLVRAYGSPTIELDAELEVIARMLGQFDRWLDRFQPSYEAAEMPVFNQQFKYAGSLDAILVLDGVRLIVDYKSRREPLDSRGNAQRPYAETALQLAAYRHAELAAWFKARRVEKFQRRYYLLSGDEKVLAKPMPQVAGGLCLVITTQSCEAFPVKCDQEVFDFFLYCFESWRWLEDVSKRVIGDALVAPGD
jgi:hypothetical protein